MVWVALLLGPYLEFSRFKIPTVHDALRSILTVAGASGKLVKWCLRLSKFVRNVGHRPGIRHQAADALLRLSDDCEDRNGLNDALPVLEIVLVNEAKEAEGIEENPHTVSEVLNKIVPGLSIVSKIAKLLFIVPTTDQFLAELSKDLLYRQLTSFVRTPVPTTTTIALESSFLFSTLTKQYINPFHDHLKRTFYTRVSPHD